MSKIWEKCFKKIIERCIGEDPFHRRQYGFRKKRSTVGAITQVMKFADTCKQRRVICVMIALDISNAFNSLSWESIIKEFDRRKLPWKIRRLIGNYLSKRRIILSNQYGTVEHEVTAGVPQVSVLVPLLWNLVYDPLLERFENMVMVRATAFADDLAITCAVEKNEGASTKVNAMLKTVKDWCKSVGLTLATKKTKVMLLTGMRAPRVIGLNLGSSDTVTGEHIKYLGVTIDTHRKFDIHIEMVCSKADKLTGLSGLPLRGILPNINGPPSLARRLYYNV